MFFFAVTDKNISKCSCLILVLKIENEYGAERNALGAAGASYINWAAKMALGLDTGVPWVMCKDDYAPDPIVSFP